MNKVLTKGNVLVNEIKIGDIHYEFGYGIGMKVEVLTLPERSEEGYWTWKSRNVLTEHEISYGVSEGMAHYGPNLYDYEAYSVKQYS
jgi:hypothetical protein